MKTETVVARESQHTSLERARDFRCWLLEINGPLASLADEQFRVYEETFPKSEAIAWAFKGNSHQALIHSLRLLFGRCKDGYIAPDRLGHDEDASVEYQRGWDACCASFAKLAQLSNAEQALRLAQGEK